MTFGGEKPGHLAAAEHDGPDAGGEVAVSRTLEWWQAAFLMVAETVSIGVLSLPSVLATVGLVPGIICIAGFGLITTYTGYVIGQFKAAYPHVYNAPDVGRVLLGSSGYYAFAFFQLVYLIFVQSAHLVTFVDAFNTITVHATCSIVFSVVGLVLFILASAPPTLRGVSYVSAASCLSILSALLIVLIATGIDYHPAQLPPLTQRIDLFPGSVPFYIAFASVAQIGFGYAGHITFFAIISDFRQPRHYPYALYSLQTAATTLYILVAALLYIFIGPSVPSPALAAAGPTIRRVAFGIALVTILGSGAIIGHINAKLLYQLARRHWHRLAPPVAPGSRKGLPLWLVCVVVVWLPAWIIAESVPILGALLSLISAIFVSWFAFGVSDVMWFHLNAKGGRWRRGWRKLALSAVNGFILVVAATLFGVGAYASGRQISELPAGGSWSCRAQ